MITMNVMSSGLLQVGDKVAGCAVGLYFVISKEGVQVGGAHPVRLVGLFVFASAFLCVTLVLENTGPVHTSPWTVQFQPCTHCC
jgi:hypothetical protein